MSLTLHGIPAPRASLVQRAAPELELHSCDLVPDPCAGTGAGGQGRARAGAAPREAKAG
jgi:hypothetical protein